MNSLELKVPPPLLALITGLGMLGLAQCPPHWQLPVLWRYGLAMGLAALGVCSALAGFISFRLAKTTISPIHPERASSLVRKGIYRFTRNPMYVGLLLVLAGLAVFLQSVLALMGLVFFLFWINRFQIQPEERFLSQLFGEDYHHYCQHVRRWF